MRFVGIVLGLLIVAGIGGYLFLSSHVMDIDLGTLRQRYALPVSKYVPVDGVEMHVTDEPAQGVEDGVPVVLLHASFMMLRSWDPVMPALLAHRRVVRFDRLGVGLTGTDPKDDYSTEREVALLDQLTRQLGIERFVLVGTSSGGTVAYRYAAMHPERVERLALINSAGMPRTAVNDPNRARGNAAYQWVIEQYRWPAWWRESIGVNFPSAPPPDWLVQEAYDINRRDSLRDTGIKVLKTYHPGPAQQVLPLVQAPTLILWGAKNPTVMHLEADVFSYWMTGAPTLVKKYPELGHYPYVEQPQAVADDLVAFIGGKMDAELRRTVRAAGP